ncbi:PQQ-like beta-propeller repeat protein [Haloterrigena sp. SYSU A558-1]|uniref:PQQ-like beta-propeller repeat protein n=1 Tax=Haloterrigena gelatinilytica TaxID=2741724 RepID=A0ABX2LCK5_9EURY|nr:PQQ-binding-like beta-propeller repeat protein [Haloterrigena gelatinilytica]NUC72859.1 PQQ-like beta-propeller repeat protein [Haloterrigena gelatinilytica]
MNRRTFLARAAAGVGVSAAVGLTPLNPLAPDSRREASAETTTPASSEESTETEQPAHYLWTDDRFGGVSGLVTDTTGDELYVSRGTTVERIDAGSGEVEWDVESEQSIEEPVAVGGETVFAVGRHGRLVAAGRDGGDRLWFEDTNAFSPARPIVDDETVVVAGRYVSAYGIDSGERQWSSSDRFTSPRTLRSGRHLYVGDHRNTAKLDLRDGSTVWQFDNGDRVGGPSFNFVLDSQRDLLFGTNSGTLYAVDATAGSLEWTAEDPGTFRSLAATDAGLVYCLETDAGNSQFGVIDLDDREILWEKIASLDFEEWEYGRVTTDLTVYGGAILVGTSSGHLATIDPGAGRFRAATTAHDDGIDRLSVDGDRAYLTGSRVLRGVDLAETALVR